MSILIKTHLVGSLVGLLLGSILGVKAKKGTNSGLTLLVVRRLIPGWAIAQAWGEVILVQSGWRNKASFEELTEVIAHKLVHVDQWRRCGVLFPLLYLLSSVWGFLKGGHHYWSNKFEGEARTLSVLKYEEAARIALEISENPYLK